MTSENTKPKRGAPRKDWRRPASAGEPIGRLTILGPAYPYRGGLASIMEIMARTFAARGSKVDIKTFTVQYPSFLFPGKTQYSESPPPEGLAIERLVNTANPFNWLKVGRKLRDKKPDVILMKYWTPFMAPCFGTIARKARKNGHTRVLVQLDNITPHEHHITDRWFNRYFLRNVDGFIYMSQQVKDDLDTFVTSKPALFSPHPLFVNFGERVERIEACRHLGLDPEISYALFFGIIRDYKGLDVLLEAWARLKAEGFTTRKQLIVAGEFYYNKGKYVDMIAERGLADDIVLHDYFIRDDEIRYFFSAADVLIQPYRSATQSGVTQIAYHFELPMIVTDVGGLAEIVPDGVVGYVVKTSVESLTDAIRRFYTSGDAPRFVRNMAREKKRFSWEAMAAKIEELYALTLK